MKNVALHLRKLFYYPYEPVAYLTIQDGMRAVTITSNWFEYFHIIGSGFQKFKWKKSPKAYEHGRDVCKALQVTSSINCNKIVNKIIMLMSNKIVSKLSSKTENGSYRVFFSEDDLDIIGGPTPTNTHLIPYIQSYFEEYEKSCNDNEPINVGCNDIMNNTNLYYAYNKMRNTLLENSELCLDGKKILSISFSTCVSLSVELTCIVIKVYGEPFPISFYSVEELRGKITCQKITTTQMEF
jgi:hypothetical protein